jgi:hypothetical protein
MRTAISARVPTPPGSRLAASRASANTVTAEGLVNSANQQTNKQTKVNALNKREKVQKIAINKYRSGLSKG